MTNSPWRVADARLGASVTSAIAASAAVTVAGAASAQFALHLGPFYVLKTLAIFALVACAIVRGVNGRHPFSRFGAANRVTMLRAVVVVFVAGLIGEPAVPTVVWAAVVATAVVTALDGLDGQLARRSSMASEFGARFDMEVDALLILALSVLAWLHGKAGGWILCSGFIRYAFVFAGRWRQWLTRPLPPSRRRKAICVVQLVALGVIVMPPVARPLSESIAAVALGMLAGSFFIDIVWLWRHALVDLAATTDDFELTTVPVDVGA